ncbi:MAG: diaminopimelate epimerase, partial [Candidatus Omnitrophota bacterium]
GVPHAVIFVEGLEDLDVHTVGKAVRRHEHFSPEGTNVNFVEIVNRDRIKIRTYERGVEAETLACGTGVVASAIITHYKLNSTKCKRKMSAFT